MRQDAPPSRKTRRGEEGGSIVESVIVFLIIAVVLAFALPAVSQAIRAYNLRSAANHLAERITAVRALAMAKNRNLTFSFDNASGLYGFDFSDPADGLPDTTDPDDPGLTYYTQSLPSGISATFPDGNPIMIVFNSRGELPIGSADESIVIQGQAGTATVEVNLRGKVMVK